MPAAIDGPTVALSFANNFWGKDDAGVGPLLDRMASAKQTSDELRSFYSARSSIEDEYARKLMSLCRKPLGTHEMGSLRLSLDTVRGEIESMAKQHANIAAQMKTELEEPLAAFAGGMKERRKIVQNTVEKLLKIKIQQTNQVNKTRDRYENDCLKIKGYLAQGHMVMGQEERKNKARLEKTQISLATSNTEYENAVKVLEETTARWNREWKAAADKFQDLEEERLDFTKSSLWTFANIASTVCVSDDASCEKIRLSLENMDVEKDIINFISERGTGQEIPDPPKYINFCRGDVEDHHSEVSDDENYSVAQFPRSINPAFRTSSPQPSTFESHHDPNSALARDLAHQEPPAPAAREPAIASQKTSGAVVSQQDQRQRGAIQQQQQQQQYPRSINPGFRAPSPQPSTYESHHDPNSALARDLQRRDLDPPAPRDLRRNDTNPPYSRELQRSEPNSSYSRDLQRIEINPAYSRDLTPRDLQPRDLTPRELQTRDLQPRELQTRDLQPRELQTRDIQARDLQRHEPELSLTRDLQRHDPSPLTPRDMARSEPPISSKEPIGLPQKASGSVVAPQERRQGSTSTQQYDASQFAAVPHDPYPMDGMTMLCRTDGMNSATSSNLSARPSSRDDNSEYSNPTSFSSQEPPSGKVSPIKQEPVVVAQPEKRMMKKKSGFFQNHSPFRRKSVKDIQQPQQSSNRNTWGPVATTSSQSTPISRRPQVYQPPEPQTVIPDRIEKTASPEPIEANASLALNIGQNVFPVANTDKRKKAAAAESEPAPREQDPIAAALAELKGVGVGGNKQAVGRISADHYHGIATPQPDRPAPERTIPDRTAPDRSPAMSRSVPVPRASTDAAAGMRGTPPPSYDQQVQRLGVPPPAVTSKAMQEASRKYVEQTRDIFSARRPGSGVYSHSFNSSTSSRPATRGNEMPRAASPAAPRSASPQPQARTHQETRQSQSYRSASPNPYSSSQTRNSPAASPSSYGGSRQRESPAASPSSYGASRNSPQATMSVKRGSESGYYGHNSPNNSIRATSPSPYRGDYSRPTSRAGEMAMQLAPVNGEGSVYGSMRGRGNGRPDTSSSSRAMTFYDGRDPVAETSRQRSKSVADPSRQYTPDGRAILHYARALYMYQAAIPEELGFAKGDTLAVLRHQDDGWWEAEIHSGQGVGRGGLVPSNYLQPC
ncbi:uncharacterized protein F4822DRAFT_407573 [Hypoxylon trugodes]|uniref:uncharacterized protein n=1 Tax=Hypoxylon trugodes TaxID=326681 RepID=UPI00219B3180|nr:uncharacterized protein F4822DRAFT_407573 [Hypoxylon trugodes]KAI1387782.1 hypothetical protein F4822DRAFT_407573 [Hypoxylon trugodes]